MENIKNIKVIKASNLLGLQCYDITTGNIIGKVIDLNYNPKSGKIEDIQIKLAKKIEDKKKLIVNFNKVTTIGDIILIDLF